MKTYKIIRFYQLTDNKKQRKENEVIKTGLTLEEAKRHCSQENTHSSDWFDGFTEEK